MKQHATLCAVLAAVMLWGSTAKAQAVSELEDQWTDSAQLALAQCLVGEADWGRNTEYSAISHLLVRRWERRRSSVSLEGFIRQYCAVHRVSRPTPRQQWVRNLPLGPLEENPGFPPTVTWTNFVTPWNKVLGFVAGFIRGEYRDPTPNADHWGGAMDGTPIGGRLIPAAVPSVDPATQGRTVQLVNRFYAVDMAARRRHMEARRQYVRDLANGRAVVSASSARGAY